MKTSSTKNDVPRQLDNAELPGKCTVCHYNLPLEEVAMAGYIGILVVRLCETCFTGLYMVFSGIIEDNKKK